MATIRNSINLNDRMTPVLRNIIKALDSTVTAMAGVDRISNTAFTQARRDITNAQAALDRFNNELTQTPPQINNANRGFTIMRGIVANIASNLISQIPQAMQKIIQTADAYNATNARIQAINDGLQTNEQLQEMIRQSADRSHANYMETAATVSKLAMNAGDAFNNTAEVVMFAELLNKQFASAGASQAAISSATLQLTQALGSGVLRGEELNAVFEASPNIIKTIADYLGVSVGEIRKLASEGKITADVVKNAMFASANEINNAFSQAATSWSAVWNKAVNRVIEIIEPLLVALGQAAAWAYENWDAIEPVLVAIAAAATVVGLALLGMSIYTWIATGAAWAFAAALLANPLTWIALLIGIVVYYIYKWIQSVGGLQNAWELCKMALMIAWKTLQLAFYVWVNAILTMVENVKVGWMVAFMAISNFLGDWKVTVLTIIQNVINGAIDLINKFIGLLNKIPGVSIDAVEKVTFATEAAAKNDAEKQARQQNLENTISEIQAARMERENNMNTLAKEIVEGANELSNTYASMKSEAAAQAGESGSQGFDALAMAAGNPTINGGTLDGIKNDISISDEDIKLLKDVAAAEWVNKYTTLRPEMTVTFGDVRETADAGQLLGVIEQMVEDAYASALVGEGL